MFTWFALWVVLKIENLKRSVPWRQRDWKVGRVWGTRKDDHIIQGTWFWSRKWQVTIAFMVVCVCFWYLLIHGVNNLILVYSSILYKMRFQVCGNDSITRIGVSLFLVGEMMSWLFLFGSWRSMTSFKMNFQQHEINMPAQLALFKLWYKENDIWFYLSLLKCSFLRGNVSSVALQSLGFIFFNSKDKNSKCRMYVFVCCFLFPLACLATS